MLLFFASKKESGWSYWSAARKKPQISGWVHLCKTDRQRLYHPHISRAWWDLYATFRGNTVEQAAHRFFSKHLWPQTTEEKNFAVRMRIKQAKQLKNVESFYHPKTKLVIDEVLKMTHYQTSHFLVLGLEPLYFVRPVQHLGVYDSHQLPSSWKRRARSPMFALVTASPSFASREAVRQGTPWEALRQGKPWEAAPCLSKRIICSRFYQHASPGVNISSLSNVRIDLYRYQQFQPLKVIEVAVNIKISYLSFF